MPQSLIHLRRRGYYQESETAERVVHDQTELHGILIGRYRYQSTYYYCIKNPDSENDIWFTISGQCPLGWEFEQTLNNDEEE